jgi:glycosyltransferase involved in cell wall biosynthesis
MDFGYSLGVLHHVPDTFSGIRSCVKKLKPGAPFLMYLYYAFDTKPIWYGFIWKITDVVRTAVSKLPFFLKYIVSQLIAVFVYYPLVKVEVIMEKFGVNIDKLPLSFYKNLSFYTMRTDAFDRFGTQLEKRFSAEEIERMMERAGLERIVFNKSYPYWCVLGYRSMDNLAVKDEAVDLSRLYNSRILFLPKYAKDVASTRYRFLQYIPYLKDKYNVRCEVSSFFKEGYLQKKFNLRAVSHLDLIKALTSRLKVALSAKNHDLVFLYCEAVPYFPLIIEKLLKKSGVMLAYDFDDAIFHNYDQHPNFFVRLFLGNKIKKVLAMADIVVAGNSYLAEYARKVNPEVFIIPTVVDINRYIAKDYGQISEKPFTIGWIGSPTTAAYLIPILSVLKRFCAANKARVVFVGSGKVPGINKDFEIYEWSEASEIENLLSFDVGIMPLPDTSWARGKCGFKLIQYMACGLPVIASPVGVNNEIVENNKNGFLAETDEQWFKYLSVLYCDIDLRKKMGSVGRSKIMDQYSLQSTSHNLAVLLNKAIPNKEK